MIKPIETEYNGYRFRSRLEARWAVFFDSAGIKYQYEPQGFTAEDGTKYLPDFYLPELDVWCEVKPNRPGAQEELKKAISFIKWGGPIKVLVVLSDIPNKYDGGLWHYPCYYYRFGEKVDCFEDVCAGWWYFSNDYTTSSYGRISHANYNKPCHWSSRKHIYGIDAESDTVLDGMVWDDEDSLYDLNRTHMNKLIFDSLDKARQARFEHSETPNKESNNE